VDIISQLITYFTYDNIITANSFFYCSFFQQIMDHKRKVTVHVFNITFIVKLSL